MNANFGKIVKLAVTVASLGLTVVSGYLAEKELDDKVTKKVAEALANNSKEGA